MADYRKIIDQLNRLSTEEINRNTANIDSLGSLEIARLINAEDKTVALVVEQALPQIAQTAELFASTIKNGGRVIYFGAGTSGRLGVLDAAECPPTFGTDPQQIVGLISGGYRTLVQSQEGVEDRVEKAVSDLKDISLSESDLLIGIAASCRTPYTLAGLEHAISVAAKTAFLICNKADEDLMNDPVIEGINVIIPLPVGPEAITGSTRMKSGTAQKMALNMISTIAMVLMGKTFGNIMIDLQARSEKLGARSRKILIDLFGIDLDRADRLLEAAGGSVKVAAAMKTLNCKRDEAVKKLSEVDGFVSRLKPS